MMQSQVSKPKAEQTILDRIMIVMNLCLAAFCSYALWFILTIKAPGIPWYRKEIEIFFFVGFLLGGIGSLLAGLSLLSSRSRRTALYPQYLGLVGGSCILTALVFRILRRGIYPGNEPALLALGFVGLALCGVFILCGRLARGEEK